MRNLISLLLLSCTLFLNAQTYSFEKTTTLEDQNLEDPTELFEFKGQIYFVATSFTGETGTIDLYRLNEDNEGELVVQLMSTDYGRFGEYEFKKVVTDNRLFVLRKTHAAAKPALWQSENGVDFNRLVDPFGGVDVSYPNYTEFYVTNNKLYYPMPTDSEGYELFACDLTSLTVTCMNIMSGEYLPYGITTPCLYKNKLYLAVMDNEGAELWSIDADNKASMVDDFVDGYTSFAPQGFITYQDKLYFSAQTEATGFELYRYDGTNIELVADINGDKGGAEGSNPANKIVFDNKLYFTATSVSGNNLYQYDGQTVSAIDFPGAGSSSATYLTAFDNHLFGQGNTSETGTELFYLNNDKPSMIDIETGMSGFFPGYSEPKYLTTANDKLYFLATKNKNTNIFQVSASQATALTTPQKQVAFSITPNPASDFININLGNGTLQGMVTIFDISGQQVISQAIETNNNRINISSLAKGIYIVSFNDGTETFMQKVRIQ